MSSQKDIKHQHNQRQIKAEKGTWACWEELLTQWQGNLKKKTNKPVHSHSKTKSECFLKILSLYSFKYFHYMVWGHQHTLKKKGYKPERGSKWNEILMEIFIWK